MSHVQTYLSEVSEIAKDLPLEDIERMAQSLSRMKGKLFIAGLGGSLANAIHLAADFRKLFNLNAEAFDNIAELTARANDEGFATIFGCWTSESNAWDKLLILSVGGGTDHVSQPLIYAIDNFKGQVLGITGPDGGYTGQKASICIKVPAGRQRITPHTEAFQMVIGHCLVSHPLLQKNRTVW